MNSWRRSLRGWKRRSEEKRRSRLRLRPAAAARRVRESVTHSLGGVTQAEADSTAEETWERENQLCVAQQKWSPASSEAFSMSRGGLEPPTLGLKGPCSAIELTAHAARV
jgi:hypothetical protein